MQTENNAAKKYPELRDTRQHLYSFTSILQVPPTSIYTEPNEKKMSRDFPGRVVPLCDRSSGPSGVGHWARACTCMCRWFGSLGDRTLASPTRDSSATPFTTRLSSTLSTMQLRENNSLSRLPVQTLPGQPPGPPRRSVRHFATIRPERAGLPGRRGKGSRNSLSFSFMGFV